MLERKECLNCGYIWIGPPGAWDQQSTKGCPKCEHLYWRVEEMKKDDVHKDRKK